MMKRTAFRGLALAALMAVAPAHAEDEPPDFVLTTLTIIGGGNYGEEVRPSDTTVPPETLTPPALAPTPVLRESAEVGAEWFAAQDGMASGPLTAGDILQAPVSRLERMKLWRPGMQSWVAARDLGWVNGTDALPVPINPIFVLALPPPAPEDILPSAVWYVRDAVGEPWYGPVTEVTLIERLSKWDGFGMGPQAWRSDAPYWHATDFIRRHQPLPYVAEPKRQPHSQPVGPGTLKDPDAAARLKQRLAGYWMVRGPSTDGYTSDVMQVMFDPRGIMSAKSGVAPVDGEPDSGSDWQAASFVIQPLGESEMLLTISVGYPGFPYGEPHVLKLTLIDDETLRDDWSGIILKRAARLPS